MTGKRSQRGTDPYVPCCWQGGRRKVSYRTKAQAKRAGDGGNFKGERIAPMRAYRCDHCGWFHLTSQPRRKASDPPLK